MIMKQNYLHISKMKAMLLVSLLILAVLLGTACRANSPKRFTTDILGSFDTVITIIAYCDTEDDFRRLESYASERFYELHQLFDRYQRYENVNNVNYINSQAGQNPVTVEHDLYELIEISIDWYEASPGATNIALGPVLELWHDYRVSGLANPDQAMLPPMDELEAAAAYTDIYAIELDPANSTIFLPDKHMRLDLGAIAKGYATELVAQELTDMGFDSILISSGGNVRATGGPRDENRTKWGIGIQNPDPSSDASEDQLIDTVFATDLSVVTSGDYQRYYVVDGVDYHHIVDPQTLMPGNYYQAVTVVTKDSGFADFLSTTVFLLPYEQSRAYVESLPEAEALWVMPDGTVHVTEGLLAMLKERGGAINPPPAE